MLDSEWILGHVRGITVLTHTVCWSDVDVAGCTLDQARRRAELHDRQAHAVTEGQGTTNGDHTQGEHIVSDRALSERAPLMPGALLRLITP